jgi:hypothetical protein
MHTLLVVCLRLGGRLLSVVAGLELHRGCAVQAVHEPAGVVPVDPLGGEHLDVGQPVERTPPERRVRADGVGLVQADGGLGQGVVVGVPDRADRGLETGDPVCILAQKDSIIALS